MVLHAVSHNFARVKVDSYDFLPLEKTMTFRNVIILMKLVFNRDKNNYCYNIFSEKVSFELLKKKVFV